MKNLVDQFIDYFNSFLNNWQIHRVKILKYVGHRFDKKAVILFAPRGLEDKALCLDVAYIYHNACLLELFYRTKNCFGSVNNREEINDNGFVKEVDVGDRDYEYSFINNNIYNNLTCSWYDLTLNNNIYGAGRIIVSSNPVVGNNNSNQNVTPAYFNQIIDICNQILGLL